MKLGQNVPLPEKPSKDILDTFKAPNVNNVFFETNEFTSLCPITGQPDWCLIRISYDPVALCLESKSLKLYLQSFRTEKGFIEQLCERIWEDIDYVVQPSFLSVSIKSTPRGGISIEATKREYCLPRNIKEVA